MQPVVSFVSDPPHRDAGSLQPMTTPDAFRLEPGTPAPAFSATDDSDTTRSLQDYAGRRLVIYFYPRAFTPGCTTEACDFRDRHEILEGLGFAVLGVSPDTPEKLSEFREEYGLPFPLLSDPDHRIAAAYGAYGTKTNYGREYQGIIRSTILIDEDGLVSEAFYNVRAKGHAERIVSAVSSDE